MKDRAPTLEDWKSLHETAREFGKIESWKWMADDDLFGVQNPTTGEISYCCIMGMAKEVYGLSAYSGSDGLEGYLKVEYGEVSPEYMETRTEKLSHMDNFKDGLFHQIIGGR